jgi:hypothetical protein
VQASGDVKFSPMVDDCFQRCHSILVKIWKLDGTFSQTFMKTVPGKHADRILDFRIERAFLWIFLVWRSQLEGWVFFLSLYPI